MAFLSKPQPFITSQILTSPMTTNSPSTWFSHSISPQQEKASEMALLMGFEHHQITLSCPVPSTNEKSS